jgi:RNA polymerase sigma-70 factor (ECF subfamily)
MAWYLPAMPKEDDPATELAAEALCHADALYGFARYLSRDPEQAQDLVQETYARALSARDQFVPGGNVKAWLFRILRNLFIDTQRRANRNPLRSGLADDAEAATDQSPTEWLRGDVELDALRRVVARDIEAGLLRLTEEQRSVVLLDLEGLNEAEIAVVMGCAAGTVKSRLARARAALRGLLKEYAR